MSLSVVILAAGQGTRMRSSLPKVLHSIGGKPLLEHVINAAESLNADSIHVVYGHGGEYVKEQLSGYKRLGWIEQAEQLGTGHAVAQALPNIETHNTVLILYGDVPLIAVDTLQTLIDATDGGASMGLLTATLDNPQGYGRIVRDASGAVAAIVEEKDTTVEQKQINEINTGMLAVAGEHLHRWLPALSNKNSQGEYYLTDIIAMAVEDGIKVNTTAPARLSEICGVNNKLQLAELEREYQSAQARRLMTEGVTMLDPARFDLRGELTVGRDVVIDANVIIEGRVELGSGVSIGANTLIKDCRISDDVTILSHCVLEQSDIGQACHIGPYSRIRPDTVLAEKSRIGNFVEIKKATIGYGSKVNHLSYVGDAEIGKGVNIGAGTITCNYDGANKHKTIIEDYAFIGSDTQLVAPVKVGRGATVGAGSTIRKDVPDNELTLSRAPQTTRAGWKRPTKNS